MDPIAILGAASSLVVSLAKASKSLSDIRKGFHEAPLIIVSMITECKTITAALTHLQSLALGNPIALSPSPLSPDTIRESLDNALTGCMLILSALEVQLEKITGGESPENIGFSKKVLLLWNEETMTQLLVNLRGQHAAINTLVSLFQTESLANVHDLLQQHVAALRSHRARSLRFYQHSDVKSSTTRDRDLSIFNFSMHTFSISEVTSNFNAQLQQSTAYRNAETATVDELWQRNDELKDEIGALRDNVYNLEQEMEQKGRRIANLLDNIGSLQIQKDDLKGRLQVAIKRINVFSTYHRVFTSASAQIVQQIQNDRHEIRELEARLSSLRKSHGNSILSHLIEYHDLWDEPEHPVTMPSSQSSVVDLNNVSSLTAPAEEPPRSDTGSQASTLVESYDLISISD